MRECEVQKIFERFYQIDRSHSEEGSGLGLAITKRIVELSDGEIEISSVPDSGTTVSVRLPAPETQKNNKIVIKIMKIY